MPIIFLGAENPQFKVMNEQFNERATRALYEDLRRLVPARNIRSAKFLDKRRPSYSEQWFRVVGLQLEDAIRLAIKYGQESMHVEGLGSLNADTLMVTPETARYQGKEAMDKRVFTVVVGIGPIAWSIDPKKKYKLK